MAINSEQQRIDQRNRGKADWHQWGPYLSERQWGTVREDYSANGDAWNYFPHDHARSRAYRWGEDGLGGISDETQTLCFALAFWNGQDSILKERLFGLSNAEGNHGEDVKELYYHLDNTPTHSYMRMLYKYPQAAFPYQQLIDENARRDRQQPEFELLDTGLFSEGRYFDIFVEYAKAGPDDLLIRVTAHNRGPEPAALTVLPTLWFRNRWSFGLSANKPEISRHRSGKGKYPFVTATDEKLGQYRLYFEPTNQVLMTENETNPERLFGHPDPSAETSSPFVKDAFHQAITQKQTAPFDTQPTGTKCAPVYLETIEAGKSKTWQLRLSRKAVSDPLGTSFSKTFDSRKEECETFYTHILASDPPRMWAPKRAAWAGLLWSKQYYNYDVERWLAGDPGHPAPPPERLTGRNAKWHHLKAEDILIVPDKWEYPWFASWDHAFHAIAVCPVDLAFAKKQLLMLLQARYRSEEGEIPAYEWNFGDNNPPVEAPSAWHIYRYEKTKTGKGDLVFLKSVMDALLPNYDWWLRQRDDQRNNLFEGGFLGLDNVSLFDRSENIPAGGKLEQADGTAWMSMMSLFMMRMALELAPTDPTCEDSAIRLFKQYVKIADAMNEIARLWVDDPKQDPGFFYDVLLHPNGDKIPLKLRSMVGLSPLFSVFTIRRAELEHLPKFYQVVKEYIKSRPVEEPCYLVVEDDPEQSHLMFSLFTCEQVDNMMPYLFDENEMLGPGGIRSLSKAYQDDYTVQVDGQSFSIRYAPGESTSNLYGGNSNWRGPIWIQMNHILIYSLRRFGYYYSKKRLAVPTGSGNEMGIFEASEWLGERVLSLFNPDKNGCRPAHGDESLYQNDPYFRDLILFYEHYHGDTGRGLGASHQTGWSALITLL